MARSSDTARVMPVEASARSRLFSQDGTAALRLLDVDAEQGLAAPAAAARRRIYGKNQLDRQQRRSVISLLADQFRSIVIWLLSGAALLSVITGDIPEAIAIVCVLAINAGIGFYTSWNALRSIEALFLMTAFTAVVRRAGRTVVTPARDLSPGDIVQLEGGDIVPADLRLLEAADLHCDESALTGESAPVAKTLDPLPPDTGVADRTNMAFKGAAVTRGTGVGIVVLVGAETELGRISTLAQSAESEAHPLEKRLDKLGETLVWITVALSALIGLTGWLRGLALADMVETAIALAVAAVPEGLPVVATLALARGMLRLARRNALVERLSAVETLGATTVILTDKTGTLTANRMSVTHFLLDGRDIAVADGLDPDSDPVLRRALEIGALCNTADLADGTGTGAQDVGDPMELALLRVADTARVRPDLDATTLPEVAIHPYDPALNMMATVHSADTGFLVAVKGAPEAVLARTHQVLSDAGVQDLSEAARRDWLARIEAAARTGHRLICLAYADARDKDADPYAELILVGLVSLLDPLRADVPAAIAQSLAAGVRVVMMTGDHVTTASEIARQAGLGDGDGIMALSAADLRSLQAGTPDPELREKLVHTDVFARVTPETKLRLVAAYQDAGHVVAVTGDGVNDAPALKKADIGIAMGQRGTQVARDAADMVLKDDAFGSIIAAMRQGRIIFGNIRQFVIYLMSCNFSEILIVGLAIAAGLPAPLIPLQILFLNIVTDVFPAFALGLGEGDDSVMRRPPRDPAEQIVGARHWQDITAFGLMITLATLGALWLALTQLALPAAHATTFAFLTLALAQLWHVFNMAASGSQGLRNNVTRNRYVWAALGFCLALLGLAFMVPVFADVLDLQPLGQAELMLAVGASLLPLAAGQIWLRVRAGPRPGPRPRPRN